jgi:tetratricopeptide (TPR) repeat protein
MPHLRSQTLRARHATLGVEPASKAATLLRYFHRHGVGHLVTAGAMDEARVQLARPSVLLGLHAHADIWPSIFRLGDALWGDRFGEALAQVALGFDLSTDEDGTAYADVTGEVLRSLGAHKQGLGLARASLAARRRHHGDTHPETCVGRHNLALALEATGDLVAAEAEARAALAGFEATPNLAPIYMEQTRSSLALILIAASRPAEAVEALECHVADMASDAGHNLASALRTAGRTDDALVAFAAVIEARDGRYGPRHPKTDAARAGMADTFRAIGRHAEARAIYEELLARLEPLLGPTNAQTESVLNGLSISALQMNDSAAAGALFQRLLASREQRLGASHPKTIMTLHNMGHLHLSTGALDEAQSCFERVYQADLDNLGADHMDTAMSASALADVRAARGDIEGALTLWKQAADTMHRVLGPAHPHAAHAVANIGIGLIGADRLDEAIPYLERSVAMMAAGTAAPANRAWARNNLAIALERADRHAEALPVVRAMLEDHRQAGNAEGVASAENWLADLEDEG